MSCPGKHPFHFLYCKSSSHLTCSKDYLLLLQQLIEATRLTKLIDYFNFFSLFSVQSSRCLSAVVTDVSVIRTTPQFTPGLISCAEVWYLVHICRAYGIWFSLRAARKYTVKKKKHSLASELSCMANYWEVTNINFSEFSSLLHRKQRKQHN